MPSISLRSCRERRRRRAVVVIERQHHAVALVLLAVAESHVRRVAGRAPDPASALIQDEGEAEVRREDTEAAFADVELQDQQLEPAATAGQESLPSEPEPDTTAAGEPGEVDLDTRGYGEHRHDGDWLNHHPQSAKYRLLITGPDDAVSPRPQ